MPTPARRLAGTLACLCLLVPLLLLGAAPARAQAGAGTGTQYVTFWRGDLRIFATEKKTQVTLIDLTTGAPLALTSYTSNFPTNPFTLNNAGDSFEGDSKGQTLRVRIVVTPGGGEKPVIVWTGKLDASLKHPAAPPKTTNAWMSYLPALAPGSKENGSEVGTDLWGFTSEEMWIFARKGTAQTRITVTDLVTNVDPSGDDNYTLTPASPELVADDGFMEVYHIQGFEDDTVRVTANTDVSVLTGIGSQVAYDWTVTPASFGAGEDYRELGTLFYAFVARDLTIFPTQDNTTVTITDLTDGDDSLTFTLARGALNGAEYDLFVTDLYSRSGTGLVPRASSPQVNLTTLGASAPFDYDVVRVEADRPVLVYVGPKASDTFEYADVAYSVRTGPTSFLTYGYAQNGGAEDLQIFAYSATTSVTLTSLSYTKGFGSATHHDWSIPTPTPWQGGNAITNDWFWSSGVWAGELYRITSNGPLTVMDGDFDGANFGCFIPFVADAGLLKPIADAGPDIDLCPGSYTVTFDGSASFDTDTTQGSFTPKWTWDVDATVDSDRDSDFTNDVDAVGAVVSWTYPGPGVYTVTLTYTDDDGQTDTDVLVVRTDVNDPPTVSCPALVQGDADPRGLAFLVVQATAADDCDPQPALVNDRTAGGGDASGNYPCGKTLVTFTATDRFGLKATCQTQVDVRDVLPPDLGCPSRIDAVPDQARSARVALIATLADNCDLQPQAANDRTAGGLDATDDYPCGETLVTFTARDASGNSSLCVSQVVVTPAGPPPPLGPSLLAARVWPRGEDIDWSFRPPGLGGVAATRLYASGGKSVPTGSRTQEAEVDVPGNRFLEAAAVSKTPDMRYYQAVLLSCDLLTEGPY